MEQPIRVAAILACHNRKKLTLAALDALYAQKFDIPVSISTYLLDDGSSDGTAEAVETTFERATVIRADGSLFWNEGMRTAFAAALKDGSDYYLWLNDDTTLYTNALQTLLNTHSDLANKGRAESIVVGSVQDPNSKSLTYGGMLRNSSWHPFHFKLIPPTTKAQKCDVMNGNCVLIPSQVAIKVGNMDPGYSHAIGDIDYSLKAGKHGVDIWIAPGYAGTCSNNPLEGSWLDTSLSLKQRWDHMNSPKGLPPSDWMLFTRKHAGILWPIFGTMPYVRLVLSALSSKLRSKRIQHTA